MEGEILFQSNVFKINTKKVQGEKVDKKKELNPALNQLICQITRIWLYVFLGICMNHKEALGISKTTYES